MGFNPCETGAFTMPDKPISPLRQRMIDDTTARQFSEATQNDYVRNVRKFAAFLGLRGSPRERPESVPKLSFR
jgi:integrase/recombinase XerD